MVRTSQKSYGKTFNMCWCPTSIQVPWEFPIFSTSFWLLPTFVWSQKLTRGWLWLQPLSCNQPPSTRKNPWPGAWCKTSDWSWWPPVQPWFSCKPSTRHGWTECLTRWGAQSFPSPHLSPAGYTGWPACKEYGWSSIQWGMADNTKMILFRICGTSWQTPARMLQNQSMKIKPWYTRYFRDPEKNHQVHHSHPSPRAHGSLMRLISSTMMQTLHQREMEARNGSSWETMGSGINIQ